MAIITSEKSWNTLTAEHPHFIGIFQALNEAKNLLPIKDESGENEISKDKSGENEISKYIKKVEKLKEILLSKVKLEIINKPDTFWDPSDLTKEHPELTRIFRELTSAKYFLCVKVEYHANKISEQMKIIENLAKILPSILRADLENEKALADRVATLQIHKE